MTEFIPVDQVEWLSTKIYKEDLKADGADTFWRWEFELPEPLALWDVWDYWERERFNSMTQHLRSGMTLFDVGTEQGWCNLVYASMVGPENMVLIEPSPYFWPNIQATWQRNYPLIWPAAWYDGLLSDKTTDDRTDFVGNWPKSSQGPLIDRNSYQNLFDNDDRIPEMRLDDLVERINTIPDALTVDVEGAELAVLQGAEWVLGEYRPLVWCSIHPDLMARDYGTTPNDVFEFMDRLGYTATHISTDHESHYLFETDYHRLSLAR